MTDREPPLNEIPDRILALLRASSGWTERGQGGRLLLGMPNTWQSMSDAARVEPQVAGVYALALDRPLLYPGGSASIVYIGSTNNLRRRLTTHCRRSHNAMIRRTCASDKYSLIASSVTVPRLGAAWLLSLEAAYIDTFARAFGACPAFNSGSPDARYVSRCADCIELMQPLWQGEPLRLSDFADALGMSCAVVRRSLGSFMLSVSETSGQLEVGEPVVEFEPHLQAAQAPCADHSGNCPISARCIPNIYQEHITEWVPVRVASLIRIACRLTPSDSVGGALIYQAHKPDLAEPNTWGEIALVLARRAAGSWFPAKKIEVTVQCGGQTLGHASLHKHEILGFDLVNSPSTAAERASFWSRWETRRRTPIWKTTVETAKDEDGIEVTTTVFKDVRRRCSPDQEHATAIAAMDRAVERVFQAAEQIVANDQ